MPTTRPRYWVTETDDIAAALRLAAARWPEDATRPSRLLARLVQAGGQAIAPSHRRARERRRRAIERTSGKFTDIYTPGYIEKLHREWPA